MTNAVTPDPFNLAKLSDTIENRVFRILTNDFESVVSLEALKSIKAKLRDEISTMIVEMWNDISHLHSNPKVGPLLSKEDRLPTVQQMAEQLPSTLASPVQTGDSGKDTAALIQWRRSQVKWVFNIWLQVYGQLISRIAEGSAVAIEATVSLEGTDEPIRVPYAAEIDTINSTWQLVRRLTLEYLRVKAELLHILGEEVQRVHIDYEDDEDRHIIDARNAFWSNSAATPLLMLHSLRGLLIRTMNLDRKELPVDLRQIPTSQLLVLASGAGLSMPFPLDLLGNLVYDLEGYYANCRPLEVSVLYPYYRVLDETIKHISKTPQSSALQERAIEILEWNARSYRRKANDAAEP